MSTVFEVTEDHIRLLRAAYVGWDDCEYGAPAVNCKRPYGNSSPNVEPDIAKLLGWALEGDDGDEPCLSEQQRDRARTLHEETRHALQIFLATGEMKPGTYRLREDQYDTRSWEPVP